MIEIALSLDYYCYYSFQCYFVDPRVTIELPIFLVVELFSNVFLFSEFVFSGIPIIIGLGPFGVERRLCTSLLEIFSVVVIIMANAIVILARV